MRTKTLLLAAAALFTAGYTSIQAQVYSQNVVGYANIATPNSALNYMLTIPFAIGVSNGANEIWPLVSPGVPSLPDGSTLLIWSSTKNSFTAYISDSGSPTLWDNAAFFPTNAPVLPVGMGFFLNPGGATTNVFAGTIAVNVGTTNSTALSSSALNYLIGCAVPYAGSVTNGNNGNPDYAGGPNLSINGGLPDGSTLLVWDPNANKFVSYVSDSGSPTLWDNSAFFPTNAPSINVGQGFFLNPGGAFTWKVGL